MGFTSATTLKDSIYPKLVLNRSVDNARIQLSGFSLRDFDIDTMPNILF